MSSKIKEELAKACGIKLTSVDEDDLGLKLVNGVSEVDDDTWNALSQEAMEWYNSAADAINAKKSIPAFPDEKSAEEVKSTRRAAKPEADDATLEVGHVYNITTKRGKEVKGKVVELDDEIVVVERADGEEVELSVGSIDKFEIIGNKRAAKVDDEADEVAQQGESDVPYAPKVDDKVVVTTKRGKEVKGKVVEIIDEDDLLVLEVEGEEVEVTMSNTQSITLDAPVTVKADEEVKSTRRTSKPEVAEKVTSKEPEAEEKVTSKETEKKPRVTSTSNGGVSATQRMRELICENMKATKADISKMLTSEGITFRETTLDLVFADTTKVIGVLENLNLLK